MAQQTPPRRRTLRILLIVLAALILLPVLAVLALVATFDADSAKPRIIAAVDAATGRKLAINGPIRLVPALHPSIELNDVSLSNPAGFSRPQMAVLKRLNLQLALLPLLHRRVEIDRLVLGGADILLELNAAGEGNWQFRPTAAPGPAVPAQTPAAGSAQATPLAIHIDRIEIADGQIAYRNPRMAVPEALTIQALTIQAPPLAAGVADGPVRLTMTASSASVPFTLEGQVGPYGALFAGAQPVNLDLRLAASGATLTLAGAIGDPARLSGADLRLQGDIPDLAALSGLAHAGLPKLKAISGQARLTDLPGKPGLFTGFALHGLKLGSPQGQLDGEMAITRGSPPLVQGTLHAVRIDADALRAAWPAEVGAAVAAPASKPTPPSAPPSASPSRPSPRRLIPDHELSLDFLRAADADLTVTIGELVAGGVTYRDLAGQIALHNAALRIPSLTATIPGGKVKLSLTVDAGKPAPPVALNVSAPSLALAPFLAAFALPSYAQGDLRMDADLHGTGRSPHQLAATLDGSIGLSMENAQIDSRRLGEAMKGLEILKSVNGKSGFTALRCLAVRMDARNGAGTLRALLLDTAPVRLSGSGTLNLGEETLDVRLQTTVRMGGTGIAAPLDVGGTFLAPKVKVDAALPAPGAAAKAPFGIVIGKLGLDQLVAGDTGESCGRDLAIARGEKPPPEAATPAPTQPAGKLPKPADLLRQLLR